MRLFVLYSEQGILVLTLTLTLVARLSIEVWTA